MSFSNLVNVSRYTGNGSTSVYSYAFRIFVNTDLMVIANVSGTEYTLTLTTDYTVSGVGDTGGTVILVGASQAWMTGANLTSGVKLVIKRILPLKQETDIRNQGPFYPAIHEDQFDRDVMVEQQLKEQLDRCVKLSASTDPTVFSPALPVTLPANSFVVVNDAGTGFTTSLTAGAIVTGPSVATADLDVAIFDGTTGTLLRASPGIFRLGAAGNVGIGVVPTQLLDILKTQNSATVIRVTNQNASGGAFAGMNVTNDIENTGFFGTGSSGTTTALYKNRAIIENTSTATGTGISLIANHANGDIRMFTGGTTERLKIDNAGLVALSSLGSGVVHSSVLGLLSSSAIVNADVDAAAAIAHSKIAALTVSRALVSDGSGFVSVSATTTTQLQLLSSATGSTGTASTNLVFSTSPVLVTPNIGTPSAGVLSSCTGYAVSALTGLGTGVATFLATPSSANLASAVTDETGTNKLVFSDNCVLVTPNLGTPSSLFLNNASALPVATGISGLGSGIATWLATPSSANLLSALTDKTGTGLSMFGTAPTIDGATITGTTTLPGSGQLSSGGNLGLGVTPTNTLDVNGTMRVRPNAWTIVNGANNNVTKPTTMIARISAPSAAFNISGIVAGTDGEMLVIINETGNNMTINNGSGSSSAANQIFTFTGADVVTSGAGSVILVYDSSSWTVINSHG